jgi:hypothetical protein
MILSGRSFGLLAALRAPQHEKLLYPRLRAGTNRARRLAHRTPARPLEQIDFERTTVTQSRAAEPTKTEPGTTAPSRLLALSPAVLLGVSEKLEPCAESCRPALSRSTLTSTTALLAFDKLDEPASSPPSHPTLAPLTPTAVGNAQNNLADGQQPGGITSLDTGVTRRGSAHPAHQQGGEAGYSGPLGLAAVWCSDRWAATWCSGTGDGSGATAG